MANFCREFEAPEAPNREVGGYFCYGGEPVNKCCDHVFTAKDIKGRLMSQSEALGTNDINLLGGNAERFADATCPVCGKHVILWLKAENNSYRVVNVTAKAVENEPEPPSEEVEGPSEPHSEAKKRGRPAKIRA